MSVIILQIQIVESSEQAVHIVDPSGQEFELLEANENGHQIHLVETTEDGKQRMIMMIIKYHYKFQVPMDFHDRISHCVVDTTIHFTVSRLISVHI